MVSRAPGMRFPESLGGGAVTRRAIREEMLADEARFADGRYAPFAGSLELNPALWAKYQRPESPWDYRQLTALLLGDLHGKRLLDLGCGMGEELVYFAKLGARVTGIDISEVGIGIARRRAEHNGVASSVEALVMRADRTEFPPESFDVVHGLGILHHIGAAVGLREVHRLLRPAGIAVFYEPLGESPTLEAIKRLVMACLGPRGLPRVTEHEENLRFADVRAAGAPFAAVHLYPFHLLYRARRFAPPGLRDALRKIDSRLLALVPRLRRYAGAVVIKLQK